MKEITTKTLDFLELFKINPLFKGGVSRLSHPSLMMLDFDKPVELSKNEKLFLDNVCNRFYTPEYKLLFSGTDCLDEYDKKYHSFMFYLLKNMIPHLHFFEFYGTQHCIKDIQLMFAMRAFLSDTEDKNNINELSFGIDKLMVNQLFNDTVCYNKSLTHKTKILQNGDKKLIGYREFMEIKYPDELKMMIIEIINKINTYFFNYLYEKIENITEDMGQDRFYNIGENFHAKLTLNKGKIAIQTRRGYPKSFIISEQLLETLYEQGVVFEFMDSYRMADKSFRFNCFIDSMSNSWIVDSGSDENMLVMGYRGSSEMDAGVFFNPLINSFKFNIDENNNLSIKYPNTISENPMGIQSYFKKIIFKNVEPKKYKQNEEELTIGKVIDDIISLSEDSSTLNESKNDAKVIAKYKTILKKSNKK